MATATLPTTESVEQLLGDDATSLLEHRVRDGASVVAAPAGS